MKDSSELRSLRLLVAACLAGSALGAEGAYPLTTDSNCGCYRTNATTANYFAHHHFFDFRTLNQYARRPEPLASFEANAGADPTSQYFASPAWTSIWDIQTWNNTALMKANNSDVTGSDATVSMVNSPNNIYIERDSDPGMSNQTYMTMRTVRHQAFQSAAEIESSSQGYQFLSIRMYARTKGASGAVTAMFTYRPGPNQNLQLVQEADLEIRTQDPPTYVQYTNQPSWNATSDIPQATRNASMPGGKRWSDWAHYRMDWTPGSSTWYVNGLLSGAIQFQAPRDPAQVMFNSWSDGGSWSGNMAVHDEASLQIQWIEMVYNNTDPGAVKTGKCVNVCSIDETTKIGQPVLLGGNGNQPPAPGQGGTPGQGGSPGSGQGSGQPGRPGGGQGGSQGGRPGGGSGTGSSGRPGGGQGSGQGGQGQGSGQGTQPGRPGGGQGSGQGGSSGGSGQGGSSGGAGQPGACAAAKYSQCGGKNFNGCKSCAAGTTCRMQNDYYSQCL